MGWFSDPDYTGQFDDLLDLYKSNGHIDGEIGGNAVRYAIFSTLNDGPQNNPAYRSALMRAREDYGLTGSSSSPQWNQWQRSSGYIMMDFADNVAQPTVGAWMSLSSWLFWFKIGFLGW